MEDLGANLSWCLLDFPISLHRPSWWVWSNYPYNKVTYNLDTSNELLKHASVYSLAKFWKLTEALQDIASHGYKSAVSDSWDPENFLSSFSTLCKPVPEDLRYNTIPLGELLPTALSNVKNSREDRLVQFAMSCLQTHREIFSGDMCEHLCSHLQSQSIFLRLFVEQWSATSWTPLIVESSLVLNIKIDSYIYHTKL